MSTWAEVVSQAPSIADVAARLWPGVVALDADRSISPGSATFAVAYLATIRRDGAPRLHPFCPIIASGRLYAAIPMRSPKGDDLRRDPRCVIHAMPGPDDDELCIRATAGEVAAGDDRVSAVQDVVARSGVGGMIESVAHDPLFEFDVQQVDVAAWVDIGQPGTHAVRDRWRAS